MTADQAFQSGDLGFILLYQVGRLHVVIQGAGLRFPDPDPDQLPRDFVLLEKRVQRLARDELLSNLPFKRGSVSSWLPFSRSPTEGVNSNRPFCPPRGAHSTLLSNLLAD